MESTVLLEELETLNAGLLQEMEAEGMYGREAALTNHVHGGSRLDDGAAGYSVVWKSGQSWMGIKPTLATAKMPTARSRLPSPGRID